MPPTLLIESHIEVMNRVTDHESRIIDDNDTSVYQDS